MNISQIHVVWLEHWQNLQAKTSLLGSQYHSLLNLFSQQHRDERLQLIYFC